MAFSNLNAQQRIMVLLELLGGPKFATEMKGAAAATDLLGRNMEKSARRTFMQNQALYTLRRYAFYGTIALTAMAGAVLKLGYNYLSAMQQARVALRPVIKDQATLNGYLNQLFQISKYSPFVITDLAVAFRQMFAGFSGTGFGPQQIINTIKALTDALSFAGKIGPGQLNRVTLALQHMAFQGRLTGRVANQLGMLGVPVNRILASMGVPAGQMANISKLNINPGSFLLAMNKFIENTTGFKGAALRLSLHSFHGLLQVVRDSVSQISGAFISGGFKGGQGWLFNIAKPGGPLDRLSTVANKQGGSAGLLYLSRQLTGGQGLGRGFLLLLTVARNVGAVFAHVVIPAFMMGAHALILFWLPLTALNKVLVFLNHHSMVAKAVLAVLAAEFVITHFAALGAWTAMKLWNIATLGAVGPISRLSKGLLFMARYYIPGVDRGMIRMQALAKLNRLAFLGWATYIFVVITALRKLNDQMNKSHQTIHFRGGWWNPVTWLAYPGQKILGNHDSPSKVSMAPTSSLHSSLRGSMSPVIHTQVVLDRKVVAEAVARANADKAATR